MTNAHRQITPHRINVLDHGFVLLRNLAGPTRRMLAEGSNDLQDGNCIGRDFDADDVDPANAARMSFDQMDSNRTRENDLKLCDYLMKNKHTSPFEMIVVWVEMKIPIFVARQFVRHRTGRLFEESGMADEPALNEMSGRYVTLPAEWYVPDVVGGKAPSAKQGQADNLPESVRVAFRAMLDGQCADSYAKYLVALNWGVAPEHARLLLHLNHYTHWLWKQDLHNLMHFLMLRDHGHAQIEAQKYAQAIDVLIRNQLPNCMALYDKYRRMPA